MTTNTDFAALQQVRASGLDVAVRAHLLTMGVRLSWADADTLAVTIAHGIVTSFAIAVQVNS